MEVVGRKKSYRRPLRRSIPDRISDPDWEQIPDPHAPGALEVSQHNIATGTIVRHGGGFFAFNHREILLGEYPNFAAALHAFREIVFDDETMS